MTADATGRLTEWLWMAAVSGAAWTLLFVSGLWLATGAAGTRSLLDVVGPALLVVVAWQARPSRFPPRGRLAFVCGLLLAVALYFGLEIHRTHLALVAAGA